MSLTPDAPETSERRGPGALQGRQLVLIVVALLVVLLGVVWFVFFGGGSGEVEEAAPPAPAAQPTPEPEPKEATPKKTGGGPVETFQVFAPRDPFDPLISASSGGGTTTGDTGVVVQNGSGGGNGDAGTGGIIDQGGSTVGGHTVSVIDVFRARGRNRAQVEVDGTVYKVDEGETFAQNFQLVSASGTCASMLFGDDQFRLCEGEQILK